MQISCPQCSMQYDLDPRLLPPAGASVQCTRCGLVFTATASGQVLIQNQAPAAVTPRGGEVSRTSTSSGTRIFGNPYGATTPASGRGVPGSVHSTQVFGAVSPPEGKTPGYGTAVPVPAAASPQTTQVFGAPPPAGSVPPVGKTQVFGAPPPPPSASTTQVFGAPTLPPPSASTTQVFGAPPPPPSASTTQVFGAPSLPPPAPSAATTQTFGSSEVQAAQKATGNGGLAGRAGKASPPGMREKKAGPDVPWSTTGEHTTQAPPGEPPAPVVPARPIELPAEAVVMPRPPLPSLLDEPEAPRGGSSSSSRRSPPIELPPELNVPVRTESESPRQPDGGRRERTLFVVAAVVVLGLTALLTYPSWRNRGGELLPEAAVTTKDQAVALLRRDDAASRQQAIALLRQLVADHPKFTEAQAELVVALSLELDDTKAELQWNGREAQRLRGAISALELAKSPADWPSRVNTMRDELEALGRQRQPLEASVGTLTQQLEEALVVIRAAPEAEPAADVMARLKAQAVHAGVLGSVQAVALAERLGKVETPPHWSAIALAGYALNANTPAAALGDVSQGLDSVRQRDSTFLRAYVLGARLALRQQDPSTARALLDTVVALNPHHTLARKLQGWAASGRESTPAPGP